MCGYSGHSAQEGDEAVVACGYVTGEHLDAMRLRAACEC